MYSVMKNQNGCYFKMSTHATSSFHVLHLSKNTKVPFLIFFFRHCYANSDILFCGCCLEILNVISFLTLEVGNLIIYHVFNFQYIPKKKVNYTQIRYK